ncbi:MAG: hypothetical protein M1833_000590 [Piccolia ochrophora]|nr:MAG: hypothetical protein M1833_000590 [Piccolia ochrophora]
MVDRIVWFKSNIDHGYSYGRILETIKVSLNNVERQKAFRILEWLSCSFRPLQPYEVEDGIIFSAGESSLTSANTLRKRLQDLCGPIIEVTANSVDFVHFSAKEYILDARSGPFLDKTLAQHHMTVACLQFLCSCTGLVGSALSEDEVQCNIVKGRYRLHDYAYRFWIEHLAQVVREKPDYRSLTPALIEATYRFINLMFKSPSEIESRGIEEGRPANNHSANELLGLDLPKLRAILLKFVRYTENLSRYQRSCESGDALRKYKEQQDPTRLSVVDSRLGGHIQALIRTEVNPSPKGVSPDEVQRFIQIYGPSPFKCRFINCRSTSIGFKTENLRQKHEYHHIHIHRCAECDFSVRGSNSGQKMRKHQQTHVKADQDICLSDVPEPLRSRSDPLESNYMARVPGSSEISPGTSETFDVLAALSSNDDFGDLIQDEQMFDGESLASELEAEVLVGGKKDEETQSDSCLIRPGQVYELLHLHYQQRIVYKWGIKQLWAMLNSSDALDQCRARDKLERVSAQIKEDVCRWKLESQGQGATEGSEILRSREHLGTNTSAAGTKGVMTPTLEEYMFATFSCYFCDHYNNRLVLLYLHLRYKHPLFVRSYWIVVSLPKEKLESCERCFNKKGYETYDAARMHKNDHVLWGLVKDGEKEETINGRSIIRQYEIIEEPV